MPKDILILIGRILIALLFIPAGFQTLADIPASTSYFEGLSLPLPMLAAWGVGMVEVIGGALLLVGWMMPLAALGLAAFTVAAAFIGHFGQGGEDATLRFMHDQMFWKDLAIAGGLFILAATGAGAYSADARRL